MPIPIFTKPLKNEFGALQRVRGVDYFRYGKVKILKADGKSVTAAVRGSEKYDVKLSIDKSKLTASCTCPFYYDSGPCKHIWATMLAVEAQDMFDEESISVNTLDLNGEDPEGFEEHFDDEYDSSLEEKDVDSDKKSLINGAPPTKVGGLKNIFRFNEPKDMNATSRNRRLPIKSGAFCEVDKVLKLNKSLKKAGPVPAPWSLLLQDIENRNKNILQPSSRVLGGDLVFTLFQSEYSYVRNIQIEVGLAKKDENDAYKKPKPIAIRAEEFKIISDPTDKKILLSLFGAQAFQDNLRFQYGSVYRATSVATVPFEIVKEIVPLLVESNRFFLKTPLQDYVGPLSSDLIEGAWNLQISFLKGTNSSEYLLNPIFVRNGVKREFREVIFSLPGGIVVWKDYSISLFNDYGCFDMISTLVTGKPITISTKDAPEFIGKYLGLAKAVPLDIPEEIKPQKLEMSPAPIVRIFPPKRHENQGKYYCSVFFKYMNVEANAFPEADHVFDTAGNVIIVRDKKREREMVNFLWQEGVKPAPQNNRFMYDDDPTRQFTITIKQFPVIVSKLIDNGWNVEASGIVYRKHSKITSSITSSGTDWFDLKLHCEFDGVAADMTDLLTALKKGERFVRLGDGSFGMLPNKWLKKIAPFTRMGVDAEDKLRFKKSQTLIIDMLLYDQPDAKCDETFLKLRDELRNFSGIQKANAPGSFVGTLRPYQEEGLGWLDFLHRFNFGGCLADDMGLGKTIQVLALFTKNYCENNDNKTIRKPLVKNLIKKPGKKPSLIIAPRSLIFNWIEEAKKFAPTLRLLDYSHMSRKKSDIDTNKYDIVMATYGTLRRDIEELTTIAFDYVVLDEAQSIKNESSITAKAARLLNADHRLALSGTPVENHLGELWSIFEFLNPGMLGSAHAFSMTQQQLTTYDEASFDLLRRALRPFILRRTKAQVASDLPPKQEETLYCEMETSQRQLYENLRNHYRTSLLGIVEKGGMNKAKIQILEALLRLRQAAIHPGLIDTKRTYESSAKLETLLAQLDEVIGEGHKAIVFSQFTSMLSIVGRHLLDKRIVFEYLDGKTKDRQSKVKRFQTDPDCMLFLISLKAGGVGLNLTAAEYVFLLDPWWNPAVESQAIDRTHRIGQTKPVFAYRLICKDTVEEKILELQKGKRQLAESIITADNSIIRSLNAEDLKLLLS